MDVLNRQKGLCMCMCMRELQDLKRKHLQIALRKGHREGQMDGCMTNDAGSEGGGKGWL